ncbi:hypothetical protein [Pseudoduganella namucuonensis]|uniref:XRE family transcriptional regulator n=1 Tax=Pseudoduganella namucuonensis TaxID=1035707 RepID=A0A1I7K2J6_9BURK|nr:hypothetical protein [Pseudoduganella namucuonensis]SFU91612.1 hypothetical protein SAMN05216552_1014104 [Pseudoduganella namucuonensis]
MNGEPHSRNGDDNGKRNGDYDPNRLLDHIVEKLQLKNDAALSRLLQVEAPTISKIRHRKLRVGAGMLLRLHEVSNLSIQELRELMGDRRRRLRV